ncbi:MAG TPA: hypothetical protein VKU02_00630 [Gemmataceae bacterium]|nr:hypothetical protein [Gemmataceae bacterium]
MGAPLPRSGQLGVVFAYQDGMNAAGGLVFGPDGNLYVADGNSSRFSILRFRGVTGEFIDTFIPGNFTTLVFGRDNNIYATRATANSVLRYDGTTGAFIDEFIPTGSGGLNSPSYLFFTNSDPTTLAYVPLPQSRFLLTAVPTAVAATPFDITVTALDSSGNIDTAYQGTVTFSTSDPDSGVVLPADYAFTTGIGGDNGVHTFSSGVTLITVGDQTLTSTDTVSGITGSVTVTVGP